MEGPQHLLSLKVMRVSRPTLASHWEPFYSSSPSFSAHSTASIMSLQGNKPLTGHPKTLRDFTQANEMLTLPASFGSIQLGETFSSCLCLNNEAPADVSDIKMIAEIQTASAKVLLAEFGGAAHQLPVGGTSEHVVHHEIKELGQHVLACTVTYRLPPSVRPPPQAAEATGDPSIQMFRKFYKFVVTNPLSVKTKVHIPRSPSALMDIHERDKVFLEVHIQNTMHEPLWFERMVFEPVDGWSVHDANGQDGGSIFADAMELMQPQDMRQYVYIVNPKAASPIPPVQTPGSVIPLGRLDISWRSSYGEPGRLLTSMLSRRVAIPQQTPRIPAPPASALPSYLKRGSITSTSSPASSSRPASPAQSRPNSPFKNRPNSAAATVGARLQSPPPPLPGQPGGTAIDVSLLVRQIDHDNITLEKPFPVTYSLHVQSAIPFEKRHCDRVLTLAVQHILPPRSVPPPPSVQSVSVASTEPFTRISIDSLGTHSPTSMSPTSSTHTTPVAQTRSLPPLTIEPRQTLSDITLEGPAVGISFPSPIGAARGSQGICPVGPSTRVLERLRLGDLDAQVPQPQRKVAGSIDFDLDFMPLKDGWSAFGGLRILLVDDVYVDKGQEDGALRKPAGRAQVLKEWDVTAEAWVPC
ncbi:DUF974-domain-containing protein [Cylindrobasidium torrendii FP15055 ss-10]|uniref:DUF974-domain-containing protein n=1 Tax=Cylindrobasidium torrendii FP15055 ss-10 TaxID=1314674 RepID=A0A0D7B7R2_9AGAR|nr:DUF974-domain-containing protein [Cylindrobasidium torrendii FP15055 ss-10]